MSSFAVYPDQDRMVATLSRLQSCRKFERMTGQHPVIMVAGGNERRGITFPLNNILKRRVFNQSFEAIRGVRRSVIRFPCPTYGELLEPQHVKHPHLRNRSSKEFRVLS